MSTRNLDGKYLKRGTMYANLGSYLKELKAIEYTYPEDKRLDVPSLTELAKMAKWNSNSMSKLARGDVASINIAVAGRIIREMRRRGFPMQITDLIDYIGPDALPREVVLEEFNSEDQRA